MKKYIKIVTMSLFLASSCCASSSNSDLTFLPVLSLPFLYSFSKDQWKSAAQSTKNGAVRAFEVTAPFANRAGQAAWNGAKRASQATLDAVKEVSYDLTVVPIKRAWKNPATYAVVGAHLLAGYGLYSNGLLDKDVRVYTGIGTAILYYLTVGYHLKQSYVAGNELYGKAELREQKKFLNVTDWSEKNGISIDGSVYQTGYALWRGYTEACYNGRKQYFLNAASVVIGSKDSIDSAIEKIKNELEKTSNPADQSFTNAGLLLGKFLYPKLGIQKSRLTSLTNWIWQEDLNVPLIKNFLDDGSYFENLLRDESFLKSVGILEIDSLARLFAVKRCEKKILGMYMPWYRCSSWAANGASAHYLALLKQYFFLLGCRALCNEMTRNSVQGR